MRSTPIVCSASCTRSRPCADRHEFGGRKMACILGLDIGTTSTVGILIRLPDQVVGVASRPATLRSPRPGWAEQDPREWWANACEISRRLLSQNGVAPDEVKAIGVTGMLPAVVLLDDLHCAGRVVHRDRVAAGDDVQPIHRIIVFADIVKALGRAGVVVEGDAGADHVDEG